MNFETDKMIRNKKQNVSVNQQCQLSNQGVYLDLAKETRENGE